MSDLSAPIPLSTLREFGSLIFASGQVGRETTETIPQDFDSQARLAMSILRDNLEAAGSSFANVLKTTVFLTDQSDFEHMNSIYAEFFPIPWPARSTLIVGLALPGLKFEIEAVAHIG